MFDIGFWEIALIAVIALIVVGPEEFPALVRNIGGWLGKLRRFMSETREELDREFSKAEELKKLIEQETAIAELHRQIDPRQMEPRKMEPRKMEPGQPADMPRQQTTITTEDSNSGAEGAGARQTIAVEDDTASQDNRAVASHQSPGKDATS